MNSSQKISGTLWSALAGSLFGLGLIVSEMINPKRVIGFLDVTGQWDPTLAFVMVAALLVTSLGYALVFKRTRPYMSGKFNLPTSTHIDHRLVAGAILFGAGWGLVGLCPGPAITALGSGMIEIVVFVAAMLGGMLLFHLILRPD